jgi:FtsH-binding integral membrane protein
MSWARAWLILVAVLIPTIVAAMVADDGSTLSERMAAFVVWVVTFFIVLWLIRTLRHSAQVGQHGADQGRLGPHPEREKRP